MLESKFRDFPKKNLKKRKYMYKKEGSSIILIVILQCGLVVQERHCLLVEAGAMCTSGW